MDPPLPPPPTISNSPTSPRNMPPKIPILTPVQTTLIPTPTPTTPNTQTLPATATTSSSISPQTEKPALKLVLKLPKSSYDEAVAKATKKKLSPSPPATPYTHTPPKSPLHPTPLAQVPGFPSPLLSATTTPIRYATSPYLPPNPTPPSQSAPQAQPKEKKKRVRKEKPVTSHSALPAHSVPAMDASDSLVYTFTIGPSEISTPPPKKSKKRAASEITHNSPIESSLIPGPLLTPTPTPIPTPTPTPKKRSSKPKRESKIGDSTPISPPVESNPSTPAPSTPATPTTPTSNTPRPKKPKTIRTKKSDARLLQAVDEEAYLRMLDIMEADEEISSIESEIKALQEQRTSLRDELLHLYRNSEAPKHVLDILNGRNTLPTLADEKIGVNNDTPPNVKLSTQNETEVQFSPPSYSSMRPPLSTAGSTAVTFNPISNSKPAHTNNTPLTHSATHNIQYHVSPPTHNNNPIFLKVKVSPAPQPPQSSFSRVEYSATYTIPNSPLVRNSLISPPLIPPTSPPDTPYSPHLTMLAPSTSPRSYPPSIASKIQPYSYTLPVTPPKIPPPSKPPSSQTPISPTYSYTSPVRAHHPQPHQSQTQPLAQLHSQSQQIQKTQTPQSQSQLKQQLTAPNQPMT